MKIKVVVINKDENDDSCEVYEHQGNELRIEVTSIEEEKCQQKN